MDAAQPTSPPTAPREGRKSRIDGCIDAARDHLLSIQEDEGWWCGELEGDTILESEYVLTSYFLGQRGGERFEKAARYLRQKQRPEGGWPLYPGGPPDVSASTKAYFVLKLLGDDPDAAHMLRARETILELGGIEACNTFTRIYLAIFCQYPWSRCPAVPPEMVLLPSWAPLNLYQISSWSRTIVVPLSIIWAAKPRCPVPPEAAIPELVLKEKPRDAGVTRYVGRNPWTLFFSGLDLWLKLWERVPKKLLRGRALQAAEEWILKRLPKSDGLGAIFPPIINTIIALRCRGYELDDPVLAQQIRELEKLAIEENGTLRVQPCFSPVWDTGIALDALLESGLAGEDPAILRAARWLLDKEVREPGDWQIRVPDVEPGGWYFEHQNEFYPDCDDTAEVLKVLPQVRFPEPADEQRKEAAIRHGIDWLLGMQNRDGGWAAFDKDCDLKLLTCVPFADHNAMIDPSCADITARVLICFRRNGIPQDHPAVVAGLGFLTETQDDEGTWYGRWGCNYIYGTWLALQGLRAAGVPADDERIRRGGAWIQAHQNADGGWGETPGSYENPGLRGHGESTAAQTAWALMGLIADGPDHDDAIQRGIAYLVERQRTDGSWFDEPWTGTGFPCVFYLRYHLYATYFPLLALAAWRRSAGIGGR